MRWHTVGGMAAISAAMLAVLTAAGVFEPLELALYDARTLLRFLWQEPQLSDDQIVVVAIDDRSLAEIGPWPWPPEQYARLIDALTRAGASVIGFDIIIERSSPELVESVRRAGNVILAEAFSPRGEPITSPSPLRAAAAGTGHIHVTVDRDGVVRRLPLYFQSRPAFALAVAGRRRSPGSPVAPPVPPPPLRATDLLLFFRSYLASGDLVSTRRLQRTLSAADLLAAEGRPLPDSLPDLRGYVALVGVSALGLRRDEALTPLRALGPVPGVYLQAAAVRSLLYSDFLRRTGRVAALALVVAVVFLVALPWVSPGPSLARRLAELLLFVVAYLAVTQMIFQHFNLWVDTAAPLGAALLTEAAFVVAAQRGVERQNRFLRETFSRYVPDSVVREILRHPDLVRLAGEKREVAVLFADVRGFTALAESLPAETVFTLLNRYLEGMSAAVFAEQGTVDKYLGDGIMALFGAPVTRPDHRERALAAACAMRSRIDRLRGELLAGHLLPEGVEAPQIGIGVHAGEAMVGHVGTSRRLEYTAVGDVVNVASRLESLAAPGQILASVEAVRGTSTAARLEAEGVAPRPVTVKGRASPVWVYEL
ncbi:MAG TPA: adenylate/guanylate cyclase domain-containing protein [Firmicutes bacterium]|nr:adenylate/guanylate cyclase domain-containing protein [Bacillota bacterium]